MFSGHRFLSYSVGSAKFESSALRAIGEEARMKKLFVAAAVIALSSPAMAQVTPDALTWNENPAFPKGVKIATPVGDPAKAGT